MSGKTDEMELVDALHDYGPDANTEEEAEGCCENCENEDVPESEPPCDGCVHNEVFGGSRNCYRRRKPPVVKPKASQIMGRPIARS